MKVLAIVLLAAVAIQAAPWSGLKDPLTRYPIYKQFFENMDEKIIGGSAVTDEKKHPHQVWINMDNSYFCGGSIIAPNKILTAAHCVDGFKSFQIGAGDINRASSSPNKAEQSRSATISNVKIHPNWNSATLKGDLSIITLPTPFNMTDYVNVVAMEAPNNDTDHHVGEPTTITGYGKTSDVGGVSPTLQEVDGVIVMSNDRCKETYGQLTINDGVICLDTTNGKSSCNGDSGGPLSQMVRGKRMHIGIVSFGAKAGCTKGLPVGFTRTAYYSEWINKNM